MAVSHKLNIIALHSLFSRPAVLCQMFGWFSIVCNLAPPLSDPLLTAADKYGSVLGVDAHLLLKLRIFDESCHVQSVLNG